MGLMCIVNVLSLVSYVIFVSLFVNVINCEQFCVFVRKMYEKLSCICQRCSPTVFQQVFICIFCIYFLLHFILVFQSSAFSCTIFLCYFAISKTLYLCLFIAVQYVKENASKPYGLSLLSFMPDRVASGSKSKTLRTFVALIWTAVCKFVGSNRGAIVLEIRWDYLESVGINSNGFIHRRVWI